MAIGQSFSGRPAIQVNPCTERVPSPKAKNLASPGAPASERANRPGKLITTVTIICLVLMNQQELTVSCILFYVRPADQPATMHVPVRKYDQVGSFMMQM